MSGPGTPQQYCLRWNNYQNNLTNVFDQLLQSESFVDVTLACDGKALKAHKMVLSACSPYFQTLFFDNPCSHPIVILKDIRWSELKSVVEFMYRGEINVSQEQLAPLLKVAEMLKIRGLADVSRGHAGSEFVRSNSHVTSHTNTRESRGSGAGEFENDRPPTPSTTGSHLNSANLNLLASIQRRKRRKMSNPSERSSVSPLEPFLSIEEQLLLQQAAQAHQQQQQQNHQNSNSHHQVDLDSNDGDYRDRHGDNRSDCLSPMSSSATTNGHLNLNDPPCPLTTPNNTPNNTPGCQIPQSPRGSAIQSPLSGLQVTLSGGGTLTSNSQSTTLSSMGPTALLNLHSSAVASGSGSASGDRSSIPNEMDLKPGIVEMIREEERAKMLESSHGWLGPSGSSLQDSYQYQLQNLYQKCWANQPGVHALRFRERGPLKSWRPETMAEAIFAVLREGLSLSQAARKFDIPYPTFVLYANRVHNMLGPSADGSAGDLLSDIRPKGRGRPQRILLGSWPEEHIRGVIRAVVFRDSGLKDDGPFSFGRELCLNQAGSSQNGLDMSIHPNFASQFGSGNSSACPTPTNNSNDHHTALALLQGHGGHGGQGSSSNSPSQSPLHPSSSYQQQLLASIQQQQQQQQSSSNNNNNNSPYQQQQQQRRSSDSTTSPSSIILTKKPMTLNDPKGQGQGQGSPEMLQIKAEIPPFDPEEDVEEDLSNSDDEPRLNLRRLNSNSNSRGEITVEISRHSHTPPPSNSNNVNLDEDSNPGESAFEIRDGVTSMRRESMNTPPPNFPSAT